jgi:DNA-binding NarL/FixJ family response regulator
MTDRAPGTSGSTRVLIVDDQELVRSGLRLILERQGIDVVGEAEEGAAAIRAARSLRPDVVLMDVRMPGVDGIAATRSIVADRSSDARVLILTTFDADELVLDAMRAGASGFLLKDAPPADLLHAIAVVERGEALLAPAITRRLVERFVGEAPVDATPPDGFDELTEREREVLACIARGRSNAEIARDLFLAEPTVKTHVTRLLSKLGVRDRVQLVVLAYESGIIRPGER